MNLMVAAFLMMAASEDSCAATDAEQVSNSALVHNK
jgi:hypothetical protein